MMLRDMKDDRARFEQDQPVFLIGRDLAEGLAGAMRGLFHRREGQGAHIIGQPCFLQRPAHPHVAAETASLVGRRGEDRQGDRHGVAFFHFRAGA